MENCDRPGPSGIKKPDKDLCLPKYKNIVPCEKIVFMNNIDLYHSRYLLHLYGNQKFGTLPEGIYLHQNGEECPASTNEPSTPRAQLTSHNSNTVSDYSEDDEDLKELEAYSIKNLQSSPSIESSGSCSPQHGSPRPKRIPRLARASCSIGSAYNPPSLVDHFSPQDEPEFVEEANYYIIGTIHCPKNVPTGIHEIVLKASQDSAHFEAAIRKSATVIYDVTETNEDVFEARMALQIMLEQCDELVKSSGCKAGTNTIIRKFLLVNHIGTWCTFNAPEGQKITEMHIFERTTCLAKYKDIAEFEYEVLQAGQKYPDLFKTFVICCGITYGYEQNLLSPYFRLAWTQSEYLPVYKEGNNKLPLIHIEDLCKIVYTVALEETNSGNYIFAVEPELHTVLENINALREVALIHEMKHIQDDEEFLKHIAVKDVLIEIMSARMDFEPTYVQNKMLMRWKGNAPFVDSITGLFWEYLNTVYKPPLKVVIMGPPGVGKTKISKMLQDIYGLQNVSIKSVINTFTQRLKFLINEARSIVELTGRKDLSESLPIVSLELFILERVPVIERRIMNGKVSEEDLLVLERGWMQLLEEQTANNNRLKDESVGFIFRMFLNQPSTLKGGYVMDGYPKTPRQAACIFPEHGLASWLPRDFRSTRERSQKLLAFKNYIYNPFPNIIVMLQANEDLILNNATRCSEKYGQRSTDDLDRLEKKLDSYRKRMSCVFNVEKYFALNNTQIHYFNVELMRTNVHVAVFGEISNAIGRPLSLTSEEEIKKFAAAYIEDDEEWQMRIKHLNIGD